MKRNTRERIAVMPPMDDGRNSRFHSMSGESLMRLHLGMSNAEIQRVNEIAAQTARDSIVVLCEIKQFANVTQIPGWQWVPVAGSRD